MTLTELNNLDVPHLKEALAKCCGATAWVEKMATVFPVADKQTLLDQAEKNWFACNQQDWLEAFGHHPKIGDIRSLEEKFDNTVQWASREQGGMETASLGTIAELAAGNKLYEQKFGYIFIVCATGKPAAEMLGLLQIRLNNDPGKEIQVAMKEQNKITKIRLEKLLA